MWGAVPSPGFETEHQAWTPSSTPDFVERGGWRLGWQRGHCGAMLVELAGNLPSRMLRTSAQGEVSHWRCSATEPPMGVSAEAAGVWVPLPTGHSRRWLLKKVPRCRTSRGALGVGSRPHQSQGGKVLAVMFLHFVSLTKLRIVPAAKKNK